MSTGADSAWAVRTAVMMLAAALILSIGAANLSRSRMSTGTPVAAVEALKASPTENVEIVVEVLEARAAGSFIVGLLAKSGADYKRTPERIGLTVLSETPVIMGVPADVKVGAILHIRGRKDAAASDVAADRVVVLTTNVTIVEGP